MNLTFYIYVPLQYYCGVHVGPTLEQTLLKNLASDTNSYKVMGINVKKWIWLQMETNHDND